MAPFALPGGKETRDETKKSLVTIQDSLIGGGSDEAGRTEGGNPVHLSQTSYRERTTTYSGKITVIQGDETKDTTSDGRESGDRGKKTNSNDMGGADNNNEAGGKTGYGKFNIFCRGNRTSGIGRNNNGDGSDKGGGKEKDSGNDDGNSSSRTTNIPECITIISPTPDPMSLLLVSGQTQAPTLSLPTELSLTSMESSSFKVSPSLTTSYVPQVTNPNQATWTPELVDPATMTEPTPSNAGSDNVIYPSNSTKVQTGIVSVTSASPTGSITSPPNVPSSSSTGVPDVHRHPISMSSNATDPQAASSNGAGTAGATFDKTDERILISVGSIGGFVLVCFLIWIIRKAIRRAALPRSKETRGSRGGILSGLLVKTAIFKRRDWQNLNDSSRALNQSSPVTERTKTVADSASVGSLCSYEKVNELLPQPHTPGIQIQYQQPNPIHQHCGSPLPYATFANLAYPGNIADTRNLAPAVMYSHQAGQFSISSNRSQAGSLGTTLIPNGAGEMQYVNHHDPKDLISPCSPFQGPGQRMSDMSSLSSGFGDGEFIMPGQTLQPPLPAAIAYPSSPIGPTNRFSELLTQQGGAKRDTMYTESSEDTPARFRSLNSWVAQQSSRVNRGQKRDEASYLASVPQLPCQPGVPGIHNPPVEQKFNLMRDNEKPRPVDEIIIQMRL